MGFRLDRRLTHTTLSHDTTQNPARQTRTFGSRRTVLFRPGTWLRIPVQGRKRETARDFGVDDRRVACKNLLQSSSRFSLKKEYARNFFQKPFGEAWYKVESANFLDAISAKGMVAASHVEETPPTPLPSDFPVLELDRLFVLC